MGGREAASDQSALGRSAMAVRTRHGRGHNDVVVVELTAEEKALFKSIRFDPGSPDFFTIASENGKNVIALMRRLTNRGAIPPARMRYFTDPEFFPGVRGRSRKQVFEKNGASGTAILTHPNFLRYLRYFVCGPDLPSHIIERFRALTSDQNYEREQLRRFVRAAAREPDVEEASEEFFKLAVECGLDSADANLLRTDARAAGRRRR